MNTTKAWPHAFIADWLSRHNHKTNRDEEILGLCIAINAIEQCMKISDCMAAEKIKVETQDNKHIGMLSESMSHGWPLSKTEVQKELQQYWSCLEMRLQ